MVEEIDFTKWFKDLEAEEQEKAMRVINDIEDVLGPHGFELLHKKLQDDMKGLEDFMLDLREIFEETTEREEAELQAKKMNLIKKLDEEKLKKAIKE